MRRSKKGTLPCSTGQRSLVREGGNGERQGERGTAKRSEAAEGWGIGRTNLRSRSPSLRHLNPSPQTPQPAHTTRRASHHLKPMALLLVLYVAAADIAVVVVVVAVAAAPAAWRLLLLVTLLLLLGLLLVLQSR